MIQIGLLGYGYWGPKLARNIGASELCELAAIGDPSPERLAQARVEHSGSSLHADPAEVICDKSIQAVAVATPVDTHFQLALAALKAGKHVFVEKPMTRTSGESERLIEESTRRGLVLMVDHTFLFEPAVTTIAKILENGDLGSVRSWSSDRLNFGLVREDVNVIWDLASHDFSILDFVLRAAPTSIAAKAVAPAEGGPERIGTVTLRFGEGLLASINVSWLSSEKVRRTRVALSRGGLLYDDLAPLNKITACGTTGMETAGQSAESVEPLRRAIEHFCTCIATGRRPVCDGAAGLRIVRLLEAADASMQAGGIALELNPEGVPV